VTTFPYCRPLGDSALTIFFGDRVDSAVHAQVIAAAATLDSAPPAGTTELVPAYATMSVWFDPLQRDFGELAAELCERVAALPAEAATRQGRQWVVPVHYDGPDLAEVAERTGLTVGEVVARHSGRTYRVYLLGFVPGFAYLGELDDKLVLPRRSSPRQRVPAGSVAIAGAQTAVYPLETPGGWHLIGRTTFPLFDPARDPAAILRVGDTVRFEPAR
jgi:KipI family sensor histidine kinase inhibitor